MPDQLDTKVERICSELGFRHVQRPAPGSWALNLSVDAGVPQTLFIDKVASQRLKIVVLTRIAFNTLEEVPGNLSTALLKHNYKYLYCSWAFEQRDGLEVLSTIYRMELPHLEADFFEVVASNLVETAAALDLSIAQKLGEPISHKERTAKPSHTSSLLEDVSHRDFTKGFVQGAASRLGSLTVDAFSTMLGFGDS